ncbi:anti-sigma factor [Algibacter aquimarinus]|uniref:Anti-sigma K factor RskA C-terminal domain-containing protein n=1 Tax=Algibacter aquimarinus TaxID=1136748 RepID=A0ABP9HRV0_9FLAO
MMDKAYIIEHGILELYLLGELTPEEQIQVERVLNVDADLKNEFDFLETNFEKMAFENAINPPKEVKEILLQKIKKNQPKIIPLERNKTYKTFLYLASGIAACLLIGSIWMFTKLDEANTQIQIVEEQNQLLLEDIKALTSNLEYASKYLSIVNSPDTEQYILKGNALAPEAKVVSYVNHKSKSVIINTAQLPKLDAEHDYQMWADVDGVMIDMGVINKEDNLLAMNYIDDAESLNITIEPAGGNDHPTVSKLITNVYL